MTHEEYRNEWITTAISYLMKLGVYAQEEFEGANELAETLWGGSNNEHYLSDQSMLTSAVDAVDEELTYWGD